MRLHSLALIAAILVPMSVSAQSGPFTVSPLKEAPPQELAGPVKETLALDGYRIKDGQGKPFLDFWLRKGIPASAKPAGPKGAILFPILVEGELLGAARYAAEGFDYRDQAIEPGVFTLRYGLQPVNGDHLGVSETRDYALLLPAARDTSPDVPTRKKLESQSAEAAGSNHPAVLYLLASKEAGPSVTQDDSKMRWTLVLPLALTVKGDSTAATLPVQFVIVGTAPQ
ncbi:MAG: hypothetical protein ABI353_08430 [Isosphaeraceae bacterium]